MQSLNEWLFDLVQGKDYPLFLLSPFGTIETREIGGKTLVCRHSEMEQNLIEECDILRADAKAQNEEYEGLFTMVYFWQNEAWEVVEPFFFTATEIYGRDGFSLSKNLCDTKATNTSRRFFGRWGDDYERHIGQLSNAMFPQNQIKFPKTKERWIDALFERINGGYYAPKRGIWFIAKAWSRIDVDWEGKHVYLKDLVSELKKQTKGEIE